jgi:soluble cytochrome b562
MASKRILKRNINYLASEIISECLIYKSFNPDVKAEKVEEIMAQVLDRRAEMLREANKTKVADVKKHFADIQKGFESCISLLDALDPEK